MVFRGFNEQLRKSLGREGGLAPAADLLEMDLREEYGHEVFHGR